MDDDDDDDALRMKTKCSAKRFIVLKMQLHVVLIDQRDLSFLELQLKKMA